MLVGSWQEASRGAMLTSSIALRVWEKYAQHTKKTVYYASSGLDQTLTSKSHLWPIICKYIVKITVLRLVACKVLVKTMSLKGPGVKLLVKTMLLTRPGI